MYELPETVAQAKFSLEFALAAIALRGRCSLAEFDEATVADPAIRAYYPRIRRFAIDKGEGEFPTRVEIDLQDGRSDSIEVSMPAGSLAAPFTEAQQWAKFDQCAEGLVSPAALAALHSRLDRLEQLETVAPIMDLLGAAA
jgi:2-methylcitrate dehydratase PrpD